MERHGKSVDEIDTLSVLLLRLLPSLTLKLALAGGLRGIDGDRLACRVDHKRHELTPMTHSLQFYS